MSCKHLTQVLSLSKIGVTLTSKTKNKNNKKTLNKQKEKIKWDSNDLVLTYYEQKYYRFLFMLLLSRKSSSLEIFISSAPYLVEKE